MNTPSLPIEVRTQRLPGYGYKLNGDGRYGLDVAMGTSDIDENRMSIVLPFADGRRRDGVGDLLEIGGIRTERHQVNPIILFDHGQGEVKLPIALAEDPDTNEYTVFLDPVSQTATAKCFFYKGTGLNGVSKDEEFQHALFCEQLFDLMAKRYVRAGSIGYQVIRASPLPADPSKGTPQGLHLQSVLMLEASAVVLPANGDTVRKVLCMDRVCGKTLSPMLVKSLTPYATETKTSVAISTKDIIAGGLAEGKKPEDFDPEQLAAGTKVEMEHTRDENTAREIAMDHLTEDPDYYRKLQKIEGKSQPSDDISPEKARQILHDGTVHGHPLTEKQRGMFGAAASRDKKIKELRSKYKKSRRARQRNEKASPAPINKFRKGKSMSVETKAMDITAKDKEEELIQDDSQADDVDLEAAPTEKFGAQVLRKLHEYRNHLMEEYDSYMSLLEDDDVKTHLQETLEDMEDRMTHVEKLFKKKYSEYPGLGEVETDDVEEVGGETKDMDTMDDEAIPADSSDDRMDHEPTPEEVVEGMDKDPDAVREGSSEVEEEEEDEDKFRKSLRNKYRKKKMDSTCGECGKAGCTCDKCMTGPNAGMTGPCPYQEDETRGARSDPKKKPKPAPAAVEKEPTDEQPVAEGATASEHANVQEGEPLGDEEHQEKPGAEATGEEIPNEPGDEEHQKKPGRGKDFEDYERKAIGEAVGYLGELATAQSFDEEGRMKSYHYHKTMEGIGTLAQAHQDLSHTPPTSHVPPAEWEPGVGAKSIPGDPNWMEEEAMEEEHEGRKMCKGASQFFLELSRTRDFGDPHRERAGFWAKQLEPHSQMTPEEPMEPEEPSGDAPPGIVTEEATPPEVEEPEDLDAEMMTKNLEELFQKNNNLMEELYSRMDALCKV